MVGEGAARWPRADHPLAMVGVLALLLVVIRFSRFDYTLADFLFNLEGGAWSLRHHPVFERGFHQGGRELIVILAALLLTAWTCTFPVRRLRRFRRPLGYLLASMAVGTLLVSGWKAVSADLCPWSMVRYGGEQFVQPGSVSAGIAGHCFPAGHASAGFCLFGLFFLAERYRPRWRWRALAVPLMLGGVFGLTQQISRRSLRLPRSVGGLVLLVCRLGACPFVPRRISRIGQQSGMPRRRTIRTQALTVLPSALRRGC